MTGLLPIVVEQGKEVAAGLRASVSHTLSDVWNAVVGDRIAAWRLSRMISIQSKVLEILADSNTVLDRDKLPENYALRWFEEASKSEESPDISEMFARLFVEAAKGDFDARRLSLLSIVSSMSPEDAKQFRIFIRNLISDFEGESQGRGVSFVGEGLAKSPNFSQVYSQHISLDALSYFGLLTIDNAGTLTVNGGPQYTYFSAIYILSGEDGIGVRRRVTLTWLGLALANAVLPDLNPSRLARIPPP